MGTGLGVALGLFVAACGGSQQHTSTTGDPSSAADGGVQSVPRAAYGFIAVEAIEEDGSKKGLGVADNLVEHMTEVSDALPLLQQGELSIAFMLQAYKIGIPAEMDEVFKLIEAAEQRGLTVYPVPVISADDGYFPNATNFEVYTPVVQELAKQWKARGLKPTTLMVDMEPPRDLVDALGSLDLGKAVPKDHIDRERYMRGVGAYTALVDELHADGWKVGVTTQATLLADYWDDDDDLRQYFNVVLDGPKWDQVDFQLYRSAYTSQVPGLDAFFVYTFAQLAIKQFPNAAVGVGLGLTHPGPIYPETPTYKGSKSLREDVQAALAAGIPRERITVYNLKGVLVGPPVCDKIASCDPKDYHYQDNDVASWFVQAVDTNPPEDSVTTGALRTQLEAMDKLLNASENSQSGGLISDILK